MSFLSTLGKIAGIAGPLVAAPFTGGTSLLGMLGMGAKTAATIGMGLGAAGKVAGGISSGRAEGRAQEGQLQSLLASRMNQDSLDQSRLKLDAEGKRSRQLVGADLSQNWKPIQDPRMQKFGTPTGLSPEVIQMLKSRATNALTSGSDVPQMQTPQIPQAGGMDSFLNALSYGGTAAGTLQELLKRRQGQPTTGMPDPNSTAGRVNFSGMRF